MRRMLGKIVNATLVGASEIFHFFKKKDMVSLSKISHQNFLVQNQHNQTIIKSAQKSNLQDIQIT